MDYRESIQKHYESVWMSDGTSRYWYKGPVERLNPDFSALEFAPRVDRDMYLMVGMPFSEIGNFDRAGIVFRRPDAEQSNESNEIDLEKCF